MQSNDLHAYLKKTGLHTPPALTLVGLTALHKAQHRCMPFENFDVVLNREVSVEPDAIVQKLVYRARGGYCFELNGLLQQVLKTVGFTARALIGRVHLTGTASGRGHLITLVEIDNQPWIVDAGFGSATPRAPLPLVLDQPLMTDTQCFRFIQTPEYGYMLQLRVAAEFTDESADEYTWSNLYSFDLEAVCRGDITYGNFYSANAPSSVFVTSRISALPTENGIVTLLNNTLKRVENGHSEIIELPDGDAYIAALKTHFGIELDATCDQFRPLAPPML
ncbi:arylamine N-acetyltransferase [Photobacterium japonica]|uniref:arylamine N-acetyltransferase family protein n=1 Tax=Photobacterium japonica TaxID=2910235 RepID=UPI003D0F0A27